MLSAEAFYAIVDALDKNSDGSVDEKTLLDAIKESIVVDEDAVRAREAKATMDRFSRDGQSPPDGALMFPGMDAFAYEPQRMVRDDEGTVIKLKEATPKFIYAESRRKRKNATAASRKADRAQLIAELYGEWAQEQDARDRRFGIFVDDTDLHVDVEVEQEDEGEDVA